MWWWWWLRERRRESVRDFARVSGKKGLECAGGGGTLSDKIVLIVRSRNIRRLSGWARRIVTVIYATLVLFLSFYLFILRCKDDLSISPVSPGNYPVLLVLFSRLFLFARAVCKSSILLPSALRLAFPRRLPCPRCRPAALLVP